jgi:hypothetical protein
MSKFERRQHFEALCQLRALYRLRGDWDATSTISIDEVIAYAVRLLEEPDTLAEAIGIGGAADATATNPDSRR